MNWKFVISALFLSQMLTGQIIQKEKKLFVQENFESDSVTIKDIWVRDTVLLDDANIKFLNLRTDMEKKYYIWLRKRVRDVWPYVKVAVDEYNAIQDTSRYFTNEREKRKYIKHRQRELADQFEEKLKDLSVSRGQVLIKLINRETDKTAFEIIRELRGGVNAFFWNTAGGSYNLDLKATFDPYRTREDLFIDVILEKDFRSGRLERINEFR